jgi:biotin carboxyl carrier protein
VPEYNIVIGNRPYKVGLIKKEREGLFEAKINDKPVELTLEKNEDTLSSLTLTIAEKQYRVELDSIDKRTPLTVKVNNTPFTVQLQEPAKRIASPPTMPTVAKPGKREKATTEGAVVAPMAGKIVSVNVQKGDAVNVGDTVCILEAMKMENEITAPKAGAVEEVHVAEGTPVNEGDLLVLIK